MADTRDDDAPACLMFIVYVVSYVLLFWMATIAWAHLTLNGQHLPGLGWS